MIIDILQVKQLKLREESSDIKEDLPLRLRVFEKFPERPLMTRWESSRIPLRYSNEIFPHLPFKNNSKSYYIQKNLILDFIGSLPISQHPRYGIVSFLSLSTRQKTLTMMTKIQMLESAPPPLPFPREVGCWEIIYLAMQKKGE